VSIQPGKKRSGLKTAVLITAAVVVLFIIIGAISGKPHDTGPKSGGVNGIPVPTLAPIPGIVAGVQAGQDAWVAGAQSRAQLPTVVPTDTPLSAPSGVGDGDYEVGPDIKPGKYKTQGPVPDEVYPNCYWERHKPNVDSFAGIIKNDNVKGPATVTVKQGEMFETQGCQPWVLVPS